MAPTAIVSLWRCLRRFHDLSAAAKLKTMAALVAVFGVLAGRGGLAAHRLWAAEGPPARTDVYGDPLPEGARLRMGTIRLRHANASATFSADGRALISCGWQDGLIRHWDLASGRLVREMHLCKTPREKEEITSAVLSGRCVALTMKNIVVLRDAETGEERGRLPLKTGDRTGVTPSADGKFLLVKNDDGQHHTTVELWDVARDKKVKSGELANLWSMAFSRDGKRLAMIDVEHTVRLWDTASGKELRTKGAWGWGLCSSPDGKVLAVSDIGGPVKLLDTATLKEQGLLKRPEGRDQAINALEYSADGRLLAGIDLDGIVVWDIATRSVKHQLAVRGANKLTFAPDNKTLACWGWLLGSEIRLWDVANGKQLHRRDGHANPVDVLAVSPDGKLVASAAWHDPSLHLWDAATGRLLHRLKGRDDSMRTCVFSADGKQIVSSGEQGSIQLWDVALAKEGRRLARARNISAWHKTFLHPSLDGKRLSAIHFGDNEPASATVWDLTTGKTLSQRSYKIDVHRRNQPNGGYSMWIEEHVAFAPDGQSVTVRREKRLTIEDVKSGRILAVLPEKTGRPVTFSPDGQLVAAAALKPQDDPFEQPTMEGLRLIESATGQEVVNIKTGKGRLIDFSGDGRLLAVIDKEAIHILDVATGDAFFRRPRPQGVAQYPIWSLAFLPDGGGVVTGMEDGTVLIWDVPAPRQRARTRNHESLETLWTALAGEPRKAHVAVYALAAMPAATMPFLSDRVTPATAIDAKLLTKLLADLDSEKFAVREAAQRELRQLRDEIEPDLRHFLESKPTLEARRRLEAILASPRLVPPAATLRTLRAIRVLEAVGTADARQLLYKLASGATGKRETREAKAALQRLTSRPSSGR